MKTQRDMDSENTLIQAEMKLRGITYLLIGQDGEATPPNSQEIYGIGLLLEGIADEISKVNEHCLLFRSATSAPSEESAARQAVVLA